MLESFILIFLHGKHIYIHIYIQNLREMFLSLFGHFQKILKNIFFLGSLKKIGIRGFLVMHLSRKFEDLFFFFFLDVKFQFRFLGKSLAFFWLEKYDFLTCKRFFFDINSPNSPDIYNSFYQVDPKKLYYFYKCWNYQKNKFSKEFFCARKWSIFSNILE